MKKIFYLMIALLISLNLIACDGFVTSISEEVNEASSYLIKDVWKDLDHVTEDLEFPTSYKNLNLSYVSSNIELINPLGQVTQTENDEEVVIEVFFTHKTLTTLMEKRTFTFTILKKEILDPDLEILKNALSISKYALSYKETQAWKNYDPTVITFECERDGLTDYWVDDLGYSYYGSEDNDNVYCVIEGINGEYRRAIFGSDEFEQFVFYDGGYILIDLECLVPSDFELVDGYYVPKADRLQDVAKTFFYDYDYYDEWVLMVDVFNEFKIQVIDGVITSITAKSAYTETPLNGDSDSADIEYLITFSRHNDINLTIPEYTDFEEATPIEDVYNSVAMDSVITISGNITAMLGNTVYVSDSTGSIACYFQEEMDYEVGEYLKVTGTKTTYNGLIELDNITLYYDIEYLYDDNIQPKAITNFEELDNLLLQSEYISLYGVVVESVYTSSGSKGDHKLVVRNGNKTIEVFVKSYIESNFNSVFSNLKVGDSINIENIIVGYYNKPQLMVIENTTISSGKKLELNITSLIVNVFTPLEDVLSTIIVSYVENSTSTVLTSDDYIIEGSSYDPNVSGTYVITFAYKKNTAITTQLTILVKNQAKDAFIPTDALILDDVVIDYQAVPQMPSTGDVNVLVVPIAFTDKEYPVNYKTNLETAFNGTPEETGWHSVSSWYKEASYNKLNITATVLDAYNTNVPFPGPTSFDNHLDQEYAYNSLTYYDSVVDYSDYDSNDDGYIDCIYFIYLVEYSYELWWGFTTNYVGSDLNSDDNTEIAYYIFMSYYFLFDYFNDDPTILNTTVFIHEMGHVLGLDDYYDITSNTAPYGGLGGADMMDSNIGNFNVFSKTILGWITPTVVFGKDYSTTISPYEESGNSIVIAKNWNNTFFDEYFIIEFYTPNGIDSRIGTKGLFTIPGIKIYHVNAQLKTDKNINAVFDIYATNTYDSENKLISLVEADGDNNIGKPYGNYSQNSDLFVKGDTFTPTWYDGTDGGFTISIDDITDTSATISINYN